ncbi:MAG: NifB/NifX family molybdenum-iron cluster-binding protein [Nitrospiraceae bacterium]|nr:NifB/NifX family molybdenum-iron cluster-binding protein [Nitrospiraceae bacterium]
MKICFPVEQPEGLESRVYGHFGSAPFFLVVDTAGADVSVIGNRDQHHAHGACNPIMALDGRSVDAIVVGGIGAGALSRLNQAGIRVFRAMSGVVKDDMAMMQAGQLPELTLSQCCGGHDHGGGCAHH